MNLSSTFLPQTSKSGSRGHSNHLIKLVSPPLSPQCQFEWRPSLHLFSRRSRAQRQAGLLRSAQQLLTGWVAHPRPIGCPEIRPHAQESPETQPPSHRLRGVERPRPRQATVAAADPLHTPAQPSDAQPSDAQPSGAQPASCQPQRPSARLREPYPCLRAPDWHAPLARAQYAETRAAERAARYAGRANRANAPPLQHHLAQGIALDN
jgi:hypothetical protein